MNISTQIAQHVCNVIMYAGKYKMMMGNSKTESDMMNKKILVQSISQAGTPNLGKRKQETRIMILIVG